MKLILYIDLFSACIKMWVGYWKKCQKMKASKKGCERYQNIFIEKKAKSINILEERHRNLSEEEKNKEQKYGHERFLKMKFKG